MTLRDYLDLEQETWESDVMESESDVGGTDDEDYGKAFDMADDDEEDEGNDVKEEEEEAQPGDGDGEYVVPNRPKRKV